MTHWPDAVNSCFEALGAWFAWANVKRLSKDREVKGVVWQFTIAWWLWGAWNLAYYGPLLHQWVSECAGAVLVCGNAMWLYTWLKIRGEK